MERIDGTKPFENKKFQPPYPQGARETWGPPQSDFKYDHPVGLLLGLSKSMGFRTGDRLTTVAVLLTWQALNGPTDMKASRTRVGGIGKRWYQH